jgi:acetylornithine deacetylase/succinyl-diaminopimelate desuccinylase-like protein
MRTTNLPIAFALSLVLFPSSAAEAQDGRSLEDALRHQEIQDALRFVDDATATTAEFLRQIAAIVSPSGHEHERARAVAAQMREIGLTNVVVDDTPNAIGIIPGRSGRALVFVSTLDDLATVAEHQRAAGRPPRIAEGRVIGPGTNTSLTTAAILTGAHAFLQSGLTPEHDLVFAAVAQEETGLVGMKRVYESYRDRAVAFVDVLGDGRSISYGALGIHWWRVIARGPAGHTLRGGLPNVNKGIGRAVDRILGMPQAALDDDTRTRLNVAMLQSGAVFNHKPDSGWFSLDIRSLNLETIDTIEEGVRNILEGVTEETTIEFEMVPFQLTPGGQIAGARESRLVTTAAAIAEYLGHEPTLGNAGSSNMNVAIGGGTPAIGLGGGRGGERAQPGEWADIATMMRTAKHVLLLAATMGY